VDHCVRAVCGVDRAHRRPPGSDVQAPRAVRSAPGARGHDGGAHRILLEHGRANLTFSGGITCPAIFELHGASVSEDLLGLPAQLRTGAEVRVVADPRNARDVYPLRDVRTDYRSGWVTNDTLIAALAALLLVATIASQVIVVRNRRSARRES
jgi:hypothetical protein